MNTQAHRDTLDELWRQSQAEALIGLLRRGYEANATLADVLDLLRSVPSDLLASRRIVDLVVSSQARPEFQPGRASAPRVAHVASTKRVNRRPTRAQAAALEAAILDRVNTGQTPISTAQIITVMQSRFSGLKPKTVDNKIRDLCRRGKIRKHPSLRATWMRQTLAVPPTILRQGRLHSSANVVDEGGV